MAYSKIKNIIFDLGGVIINLDVNRTYQRFADMAGVSLEDIQVLIKSNSLFEDYEKGNITSTDFKDGLNLALQKEINDQEFLTAWNSMLLDIPVARLELLEKLREKYNLFILSNTNEIHIEAFKHIVGSVYDLDKYHQLFKKIYYSYEIKMKKPDREIFAHVLSDQNLVAEETIFFEDSPVNLQGAAALNIQTHQVTQNQLNLSFIKHEFF